MADAPLDESGRQGIICVSKTDGATVVPVKVDPTTHGLIIESGVGQPDNGNHEGDAIIDGNGRYSWYGLSSANDGTRILVYANATTGAVLVQT